MDEKQPSAGWCIKVEDEQESDEDYFGANFFEPTILKNAKIRKFSHETELVKEDSDDDNDLSPSDTSSCLGSRYNNHNLFLEGDNPDKDIPN